jgi:glycine/D-amino acid oxidase-like deaminating enzyme
LSTLPPRAYQLHQNGGHVQPLLFDRTSDVAEFELANCAAVAEYIKKHDIPCEYRPVSGCRTFWTRPILNEALAAVETLQKTAPELGKQVSAITDSQLLEKHNVNPACPGATITAGAASIWPYKLVTFMLRQLVQSDKINLQTNTPVETIKPFTSTSQHKNARWTLETSKGTVFAKSVLLATNGYTSHLLPAFTDLVVPVRGTMTALVPPKNAKLLPHSYGFVGLGPGANPNSDDYLVQRPFSGVPNPKGHLMFGGGRTSGKMSSMGESDDSIVDAGSVTYLSKTLLSTLNLGGDTTNLDELEAEYAWSGIMGYSRDNSPWVGSIPKSPGLFICAGYTGHGMPNSTLCARAVVEMMLKDEEGEGAEEKFHGLGREGWAEKVREDMIKGGKIPSSYVVTQERISQASMLPSVKVQDEEGCMGYDGDGRWVVMEKE